MTSTNPKPTRAFLSVSELSELLGVSPPAVRALILRGELAGVRVGTVYRVRREAFEEFIDRQEKKLAAGGKS
jgi:excisionase family DNA binding protein